MRVRRHRGAPRALAALLALAAAAGVPASPGQADGTAQASLWSADHRFSSCDTGAVQMIVGGDDDGCTGHRAAATPPAAAGHARDAGVAAATQRLRDDDRRTILLQEVARERAALARLESAGPAAATAPAVARTHANLAALARELARLP